MDNELYLCISLRVDLSSFTTVGVIDIATTQTARVVCLML